MNCCSKLSPHSFKLTPPLAGSKAALIGQICRGRGVLVTSYSAMTTHRELMTSQDWHYVILDEGHKIRNPDAQVTLAVKQVGQVKVAVTPTVKQVW